jgi:uncharacterized protein (DUF302 family)
MLIRFVSTIAAMAALAVLLSVSAPARAADDGIVRVKSAYPLEETVARIRRDIAAKGITWFTDIDQAALAAKSGIALRPSRLLVFGNPALGTLFITARAEAGIDWPVRLLVHQDADGAVWATWTDFKWIAARHGIRDRDAEFATATGVVASITSTIRR